MISQAQNATKSPYSIYGIGDLVYGGFVQNALTGRTDRSFKQENSFTYINPASLAFLKRTSFQLGARMDLGKFTTGDSAKTETSFNNSTFSYFSLGIPLSEKKGIAFSLGIMPHSSKGYNITSTGIFDSVKYVNDFGGSGGINKVFAGFGMLINKHIAVGTNFNFLFGNLAETKFRIYPNQIDKFSYSDESSTYAKGVQIDFGLQYTENLRKGFEHTLGITAQLGNSLNARRRQIIRTFNMNGVYIDTIVNDKDKAGNIELPMSYGIGYSIGKPEQLMFSLDYFTQDWAKYSAFGENPGLTQLSRYSAGLYYQPDALFEKSSSKRDHFKNYFRYTRYTAGAYYENTHLMIKGTQVTEFGITFGMQLPYVRQIKLPGGDQMTLVSRINIGADYAKRGTTKNGLIQEDYLRIYLAFNFSDKWFIKRKYQ
jgi:hypothetical protein